MIVKLTFLLKPEVFKIVYNISYHLLMRANINANDLTS